MSHWLDEHPGRAHSELAMPLGAQRRQHSKALLIPCNSYAFCHTAAGQTLSKEFKRDRGLRALASGQGPMPRPGKMGSTAWTYSNPMVSDEASDWTLGLNIAFEIKFTGFGIVIYSLYDPLRGAANHVPCTVYKHDQRATGRAHGELLAMPLRAQHR